MIGRLLVIVSTLVLISSCQTTPTSMGSSRPSGDFNLRVRSTVDISPLGDSGAVKCDIKEWISVVTPGVKYSLVNLKNRGAANASFCKGESFAGNVKGRYFFIDYEEDGVYYRTQLIQSTSYDRFPSLNHWIDMEGREDEFDPLELVDYVNTFQWQFEYMNAMEDAYFWNKQAYLSWDERHVSVSWSARNGYKKRTTQAGKKVTHCSTDAKEWTQC
jgi:hypothetical protein